MFTCYRHGNPQWCHWVTCKSAAFGPPKGLGILSLTDRHPFWKKNTFFFLNSKTLLVCSRAYTEGECSTGCIWTKWIQGTAERGGGESSLNVKMIVKLDVLLYCFYYSPFSWPGEVLILPTCSGHPAVPSFFIKDFQHLIEDTTPDKYSALLSCWDLPSLGEAPIFFWSDPWKWQDNPPCFLTELFCVAGSRGKGFRESPVILTKENKSAS